MRTISSAWRASGAGGGVPACLAAPAGLPRGGRGGRGAAAAGAACGIGQRRHRALLIRRHLAPGERITIVGLRPEWLPGLVERCGLLAPAHYDPPMGFAADPGALAAAVAFVLTHPARFAFLAVGSPQQEVLAAAIAATGGATGTGLCVGASLAFLAGAARRAPPWTRRCGLEWLFRLGSDPRRLARRYLVDSPAVLAMLLRSRFGGMG